MKHLKYVITETGKIYFGYVEFHDDIRTGYKIKDRIVGGGFFSIDKENKSIKLFGRSVDYGMPKISDFNKMLKNKEELNNSLNSLYFVVSHLLNDLDTKYNDFKFNFSSEYK